MSIEVAMAIAFIMTLGGIAYISWPIFQEKSDAPKVTVTTQDEPLRDLLTQREATYTAIKELEFDYQMGNLSEKDYEELRERYTTKALGILKGIDEEKTATSGNVEDQIEGLVAARRQGLDTSEAVAATAGRQTHGGRTLPPQPRGDLDAEVEAAIEQARGKPRRPMEIEEGLEVEIEAAIQSARTASKPAAPAPLLCPHCNTRQRDGEAKFCSRCGSSLYAACPGCGAECLPTDGFCTRCGQNLTLTPGVA